MFWSVTLSLLEGLREVVKLFALTLVFSLPLGLAVTFGSISKCRPVSWFFNVLVWIVRGTPLMLQLILIFYGPASGWATTSGAASGCWRVPWPSC